MIANMEVTLQVRTKLHLLASTTDMYITSEGNMDRPHK